MTTALVTGANRGIGLELVRLFASRGTDVIAVCRSVSTELSELPVEVVEGIEVTSDVAVRTLVEVVGKRPLDVIVLNAGILEADSLGSVDLDSVRRQFEVNSLAPLRVTNALLGNLRHGSKVVIITSRMGSIADNTSGGSYGYRMSKAAVNAFGKSLAIDLGDRGVAVAILHPGWVRTDMTGHTGNVDAAESATQLLERIETLTLQSSGEFHHMNGEELPW